MENSSSKKLQNMGSMLKKLKDKVVNFGLSLRRLGEEDPRRIVHGIKVGLAISLVSLFYSWQPLFSGFGVSAMWAVLTVVVVFEYSVGATLGKGINRMIGTSLGGALGLLVSHLANLTGPIGEPILLGVSGFLVSSMMTFMRFYPSLKARYDYALMIFILTFCLVLVSGYQLSEVTKLAHQRLSTVAIGSFITMLVCICVCPVWMGSELHDLISSNLDKLGSFLLEFGGEYFDVRSEGGIKGEHKDKSFFQKYKSVLGTKTTEEIMANLAAWEPRHGRFKFLHPWKQYLKIGASIRRCAYRLDSLNNYLDPNVDQGPLEFRLYIQDVCTNMSSELGRAMKEMALGMKKMEKTSLAAFTHISNAKSASEKLMFVLNTTDTASELLKFYNISELLPVVTVASLLLDVVSCVENITEAVSQLDSLAGFKSPAGGTAATPSTPEEIYDEAVVEEGRNGGFEDNHTPFCGSEELNYVGIDIDGQQLDHQESLEKMSAPPESCDPKK